jgi:hypothetical protein
VSAADNFIPRGEAQLFIAFGIFLCACAFVFLLRPAAERKREGWFIPVALVIIGVLIVTFGAVVLHYRSAIAAFDPVREGYLAICDADLPNRRGIATRRIVVVDSVKEAVDPLTLDLPADLRAARAADVRTIACLRCREAAIGAYSGGSHGWKTFCEVTLVDVASRTILGRADVIDDRELPTAKSGQADLHLGRPNRRILATIRSLAGSKK